MFYQENVRVLVVDDDPFFLGLMVMVLKRFGIQQIEAASNGSEILNRLAQQATEFDIILSDLNMPMMDGIELLRHLSQMQFRGGIILLTGEDQKILHVAESLARAHGLNLLGVLHKPIEVAQLQSMLDGWLTEDDKVEAAPLPELSSGELDQAIQTGQVIAHFQPRVSLITGQVACVECLARWQHPKLGLIPPVSFIPLAERNDLIGPLTDCILKYSIGQLSRWRSAGLEIKVAINITASNLTDIHFPDRLSALAGQYGIPLSSLVLELTESQLMNHLSLTLDTLIRLRLKGVTLAVDDFGTGYSNLAQIKRAPFGELKIDRSFIQMGTQDEDGHAILEASITMGKKLGLIVVAEGVETQQELTLVEQLGADEVQGYFFARPMPAKEMTVWLRQWISALSQKNSTG